MILLTRPDTAFPAFWGNILLALAYMLLGFVQLDTGVHEQIVPLWLPAGLGLAALLVYGAKLLPGIGLGSFGINLLIPVVSGPLAIEHLLSAGLIATGAVLQARLAWWLITRRGIDPIVPLRDRWMLQFLLCSGLLTCTLNASIGTFAVTFVSSSGGSQGLLLDWMTWWLGDSFGVVLGTPLFLALFEWAGVRKSKHRERKWLLPLRLGGVLLAVLLINRYYLMHLSGLLTNSFQQDVQLIEARIQALVQHNLSELLSLGQALSKEPDLTPQHFATLVAPSLNNNPGLRAYSWDPVVSREERAAFERQTSERLGIDYAVYGEPAPTDEYLIPVQYVEPLEENRQALGFNLNSRGDRRHWALQAQMQGQVVATGILNLTQAPDEPGLLMLQPVYRFVGTRDLLMRQRELQGFIVGVFTVSRLLEAALQQSGVHHVHLRVSELGQEPFYETGQPRSMMHFSLANSFQIQLTQHAWQVEAFAGADYLAAHPVSQAHYLQILLLGVGCLGALLVLSMHNREQLLEARVRQQTRDLAWQASHDDLTRLRNRKGLHEVLSQRVQQHDLPFSLLFVDLDRFKLINDSLGHQVGDRLLQELSSALLQTVSTGTEVYRMGGDEFILLVPGDVIAGEAEAQTVLRVAADTYAVAGHQLQLTASIGISLFPEHGITMESLIQHADTAMYRAKARGKDRYERYSKELTSDARLSLAVEQDLRQALQSDQLVMHYQPQYRLDDRKLCGYEALVRWQHPQQGLLGPDKFIPVAEETQLIVPLGWQILDSVCREIALWLQRGMEVPMVAVNISPQQLLQADFIQRLNAMVKDYGLTSHLLELEITESMIMQDPDFVIQQLQRLRLSGYHLALDDFGTGFSSLDRIKYLPLNRIKIDKSFTRDIGRNPKDEAVIISAIALGRSLGIEVLAEGVETAAQCEFLRQHQCSSVQGYLFGRPVSPEVIMQEQCGQTG